MNQPMRATLITFFFICILPAQASQAKNICFQCHDKEAFRQRVTHGPVAEGKCSVCHNPHVARYEGLLQQEVADLCFSCHQGIKRSSAKGISHRPVRDGQCLACHAPHASKVKGLLRGKRLSDSCFSCHRDSKRDFTYTHPPFAEGNCSACHDPHQADNHQLLKDRSDRVCGSCHARASLNKQHQNYPAPLKNCLTCHGPHGSDRKHMVRNFRHEPFADGACDACHADGERGMDACLNCHEAVREKLLTTHNHLTARAGNNCILCHSPHAGDTKNLLNGNLDNLCRTCHETTVSTSETARHRHPDADQCTNCHAVHGSDEMAMLNKDGNAVCTACHETQGRFTHPVGMKTLDPRTDQPLTCVSCHYPHGTDFKYNLKLDGSAALCIQCHRGY